MGRFEVKYLVEHKEGLEFINSVSHYMEPDRHSTNGYYKVRSLYYDTYDFINYADVVAGVVNRKKIRLRKYEVDPEKIFFEIKHRYNRTISKDRVLVTPQEFETFLANPGVYPDSDPLAKFRAEFLKHKYHPQVCIIYDRLALEDVMKTNVRVTLDSHIRCGPPSMFNRAMNTKDIVTLPPGFGVIEVKFDRLPIWLKHRLLDAELTPGRYSKYANCVERLYLGHNVIEESKKWMSF